jgi:hypothetical protein
MNPDDGTSSDATDPDPQRSLAVASTLILLATLALVAYLVSALKQDAPLEIAEVITAAAGLLTAAAAAVRALKSR